MGDTWQAAAQRISVFGKHPTQIQKMCSPDKNSGTPLFQIRPHAFTKTLITQTDNRTRSCGKFRAGAHHSLQIASQICF